MKGQAAGKRGRAGLGFALAAGLVLALGIATVPAAGAGPPATGWPPPSPLSWSNGVVQCSFGPAAPSVAASAVGSTDSGLSSGLSGLAEVSSTGQAIAVASVANANWTVANVSTPEVFDLAYRAHLELVSPSSPARIVGSTDVRVDYVLTARSPFDNMSSVSVVVQISNWTWQHPEDPLIIGLSVWPTSPRSNYLTSSGATGLEITSSSDATGAPREYFRLAPYATVTGASGVPWAVKVSPQLSLDRARASVNLTVSPGAGNVTTLSYSAQIRVALPLSIGNTPLYEYALVGGAAVFVSALVAISTYWIRRRPSEIDLVEESR
jgi:hypothetical protein